MLKGEECREEEANEGETPFKASADLIYRVLPTPPTPRSFQRAVKSLKRQRDGDEAGSLKLFAFPKEQALAKMLTLVQSFQLLPQPAQLFCVAYTNSICLAL